MGSKELASHQSNPYITLAPQNPTSSWYSETFFGFWLPEASLFSLILHPQGFSWHPQFFQKLCLLCSAPEESKTIAHRFLLVSNHCLYFWPNLELSWRKGEARRWLKRESRLAWSKEPSHWASNAHITFLSGLMIPQNFSSPFFSCFAGVGFLFPQKVPAY